jgi:hypothetical protein
VAHEIGHCVFLVHSPAAVVGDNAAHDKDDYGPCIMSYDYPKTPRHFCGLCALRMRGWDHTKLDKDGANNKKT